MAFYDSPQFDQSAKNSGKSVRRLMDVLNEETGFICRAQMPDMGCDFNVELILNGSKSSSWEFAVQLKSIEKLSLVDNKQFISYSFETSRLGYLMRRIPAMGIIVLYSVEDDKLFYDYVDKIYERLMIERENDEWKRNEKVNIRIPQNNILDQESVKGLKEIFKARFEQAMIMQNSHGDKYGLPSMSLSADFRYDFNNTDHIKKFLTEYGMLLLSNYDLEVIFRMISRLPNQEIYLSTELLLMGAISYAEAGLHTDSELFCKKLEKFELTDEQQVMMEFVKLKNRTSLGYADMDEYFKSLEQLQQKVKNKEHKITIEINLIRENLAAQKALTAIPIELEKRIKNVFTEIEGLNANERVKLILTIWNCENLSYLITAMELEAIGKVQIVQSLGEQIPLQKRIEAAKEMIDLQNFFYDKVQQVNRIASEGDDKLLKAYSLSCDVKFFIHHQINYVSSDIRVDQLDPGHFNSRITSKASYAATAYNYFNELTMGKDAYENLCNYIEILELAELQYQIQIPRSTQDMYGLKKQMEEDMDLEPRPLVFRKLISDKRKKENQDDSNGMPAIRNLDDEQIESLARIAMKTLSLPEDRLSNIVNELKAYRLFHQRCQDENIEVLQFRTPYEQLAAPYSLPVRFVLRHKKTGIETSPSSDMEYLLISWQL
jgi:hypothetical protein